MNISPLSPADVDRVVAFFERIPEGDRTFFKEPVTGAATVAGGLSDGSTRLLAVEGDDGVGSAAGNRGVRRCSRVEPRRRAAPRARPVPAARIPRRPANEGSRGRGYPLRAGQGG